MPALWPVGRAAPRLGGWSGEEDDADGLTLYDETLEVNVATSEWGGDPARCATDLLEECLAPQHGGRAAGRAAILVVARDLPATIDGATAEFCVVAALGRWVAGHESRTLQVSVSGAGDPPGRLDLIRVAQ